MTPNDCARMARAFLLYILRVYLFVNGGGGGADSVLKVAVPLSWLRGGPEDQLRLGMSCLPVLLFGHTQQRDSTSAGGALEASWRQFSHPLWHLIMHVFPILAIALIHMSSWLKNCTSHFCKMYLYLYLANMYPFFLQTVILQTVILQIVFSLFNTGLWSTIILLVGRRWIWRASVVKF